MALNTFKCNCLTPQQFKALDGQAVNKSEWSGSCTRLIGFKDFHKWDEFPAINVTVCVESSFLYCCL